MTNNAQAEMVGRLGAYPNCFVRMGDVGFAGLSDDIVAAAAEIERMAGEVEALRAAAKVLRDGYADAVGGYRYIIQRYGRMDGVGWDRVIDHYDQWVMIPECEGLLAGSHKLPAQQDKVTGQ